ncbi:phosphotransferase [Nocardiopsis changdeensis]|uniref:phosphotransferase n=1 Tax=Nocardiopsis TaxID=2013 RepID=UPI00210413E4|nr:MULTISPECIES: phosphotransferase [Nocardiopsis]
MRSLSYAVPALVGDGRPARAVRELRGGTRKGVWRVVLADGSRVVAYRWHPDHDRWPAGQGPPDPADPFSPASGPGLFAAAHALLTGAGVRVPALYALEEEGGGGALAVVEDVGPTLEQVMEADPGRAAPVLEHLASVLGVLHGRTHPVFGKVAHVAGGGAPAAASCHEAVLVRALADLEEAARLDARVGAARSALEEELCARAARIGPRPGGYALVHGELGPDHVLVAADGQGALIDFEGLMWFDHEWEHAFLRLRFADHRRLATRPVDAHRMGLYVLALDLSLVAGPLRYLAGRAVSDRGVMAGIAERALGRALASVGCGGGW